MATYNGEKYLRSQLNSLVEQSHLPYELVVCDDGSLDGTEQILLEFATRSPFPVRFIKNDINLGYADNFLKAAGLCNGGWIAFCDQDDVWLPNRLSDVAREIDRGSQAVLYLQNSILCNSDLSWRGRCFPATIPPGYHPPGSMFGFWTWHGFLQTFSRASLMKFASLSRPSHHLTRSIKMSHDDWTCLLANATGGVELLPTPAALYRRHDSALTGMHVKPTFSQSVYTSLQLSSLQYFEFAQSAFERAEYLRWLASTVDGHRQSEHFLMSAQRFDALGNIFEKRFRLHEGGSAWSRLSCLMNIAWSGGYVGSSATAMGLRSAAKDILQTIGALALVERVWKH